MQPGPQGLLSHSRDAPGCIQPESLGSPRCWFWDPFWDHRFVNNLGNLPELCQRNWAAIGIPASVSLQKVVLLFLKCIPWDSLLLQNFWNLNSGSEHTASQIPMKILSHFDGLYELSGVICRWQESGQSLCSLVSRSSFSTEHLVLKDPLLISALCYQNIVFLLKISLAALRIEKQACIIPSWRWWLFDVHLYTSWICSSLEMLHYGASSYYLPLGRKEKMCWKPESMAHLFANWLCIPFNILNLSTHFTSKVWIFNQLNFHPVA